MTSRSQKLTDFFVAGVVVALAIGLGGCGYHLAASGDALPSNAKTIYVERFANGTRFTGANDE